MTFSFDLSGSIGWSVLLNSISAPVPFAHQCSGLTPQAMNNAANRFGAVGTPSGVEDVSPHTGIDSSQGRAIATPAPRSSVRRETCNCRLSEELCMASFSGEIVASSFVEELTTGHDALNQAAEAIFVLLQPRLHVLNKLLVGQ